MAKMLDEEVLEPANTEWSSPIMFETYKDVLLCFCVDRRKLDSVTVVDSYSILQTDKYIDFSGTVKILSRLNASAGC